jgi:hypothetical protein
MIDADIAEQVAAITARVDKNLNWNTEAFMRGLVEAPSRYMLSGATSVPLLVPENVDFAAAKEMMELFGYTLELRTPPDGSSPTAILSWT